MAISKQDLVQARTPADLERRYNFNTRFAEVMGVATDAQTYAKEALDAAGNPAAKLTQDEVFNLLTNNGQTQGIFRGSDGEIYINASYLRSGIISSADGSIQINLGEGAKMPVFNTGISTNGITIRGDEVNAPELMRVGVEGDESLRHACLRLFDIEGKQIAIISEDVSGTGGGMIVENNSGTLELRVQSTEGSAGVVLSHNGQVKCYLGINEEGVSVLQAEHLNSHYLYNKKISWKDNGDGTFTLIGK